jgi:hypothetical protein
VVDPSSQGHEGAFAQRQEELALKCYKKQDAIERADAVRAGIINHLVGKDDEYKNYNADDETRVSLLAKAPPREDHPVGGASNDDAHDPEDRGSSMLLEIIGGVAKYGAWFFAFFFFFFFHVAENFAFSFLFTSNERYFSNAAVYRFIIRGKKP